MFQFLIFDFFHQSYKPLISKKRNSRNPDLMKNRNSKNPDLSKKNPPEKNGDGRAIRVPPKQSPDAMMHSSHATMLLRFAAIGILVAPAGQPDEGGEK